MSFVISHPDIEGTAVIPERALAAYASKGWLLNDRTDADPGTPTRPALEMPNRSDSAARWKTYAVASGMDYVEAFSKTRDELADKYDPQPDPPKPAPKTAPAVTPSKES